jgi:hypothetical protein
LTSPLRAAALSPTRRPRGLLAIGSGEGGDDASAAAAALPPSGTAAATAAPCGYAVGVREVVAALSRVSYQSSAGSSNVSAVRALPQQQQLCLLALASALAAGAADAAKAADAAAAAAEHGMSTQAYQSKYYWGPSTLQSKAKVKLANPFAAKAATGATDGPRVERGNVAVPAVAGAAGGIGSGGGVGCMAGDSARVVTVTAAYQQYRALCGAMFQQPCSQSEFLAQQQLLSHVGLVGVSNTGNVGGRGGGVAGAPGSKLALKASMRDIQTALKDSAVFRAVLARLPSMQ